MKVGDTVSIDGSTFKLSAPETENKQVKEKKEEECDCGVTLQGKRIKHFKSDHVKQQKEVKKPEVVTNQAPLDVLKDITTVSKNVVVSVPEKKKEKFVFPEVDSIILFALGIIIGIMLMYIWIKTNGFAF